ncbi:hypothetical protein TgHK011_006626 [Trichoderma gracile]|nr:hypothetical protein TgHK011_006626 [Trichoderma gracile]
MAPILVLLTTMLEDLYVDVDARDEHFFYLRKLRQIAGHVPKVQIVFRRVEEWLSWATRSVFLSATVTNASRKSLTEPLRLATWAKLHLVRVYLRLLSADELLIRRGESNGAEVTLEKDVWLSRLSDSWHCGKLARLRALG